MADFPSPSYGDLPAKSRELIDRLRQHSEPEVRNDALRIQMLNDEFNRVGVHRLLELIMAWRGEIFLESVFRDPVAGAFLANYGIAEPE